MKSTPILAACALLSAPIAAASAAKPEFHRLWVPPEKSAHEIKPRLEARADAPVTLELRAHRHADGTLHFECDHLHQAGVGAVPPREERGQ
jgi:hypothetical protein